MNTLKIGDIELTWLRGGTFALDGGAMFGVVPRVLWEKKYPSDELNRVTLLASPILVRTTDALLLIETGIGNKLTDKQKMIFHVTEDWEVPNHLKELGYHRDDIDIVILTHFDFDHAGGVIMHDDKGEPSLSFPKARHVLQKKEWDDVLNPNIRSINTYWPVNNEYLRSNGKLELIDGEKEIVPGVRTFHTAGHNSGHQIVIIESKGDTAIHMADLLPTHVHFNPLWVMAYDNFPLDAVAQKEKWEKWGIERNAWFTFYHDPFLRACRFDDRGTVMEKHIAV